MHAAEIIVLIAGAILFTVSFFMSDRSKGIAVLDEEEERKLIKELLDKEVEGARFRIDEAAQEAVSENKDRMERAMDRITNEKMSAVDEYSNTVLDQIHKNHDEVMFLYDMLNNKHTQVKNTAAELNQLTKSAKSIYDYRMEYVTRGELEDMKLVLEKDVTRDVSKDLLSVLITALSGMKGHITVGSFSKDEEDLQSISEKDRKETETALSELSDMWSDDD